MSETKSSTAPHEQNNKTIITSVHYIEHTQNTLGLPEVIHSQTRIGEIHLQNEESGKLQNYKLKISKIIKEYPLKSPKAL